MCATREPSICAAGAGCPEARTWVVLRGLKGLASAEQTERRPLQFHRQVHGADAQAAASRQEPGTVTLTV
jgi:hypothetical protein